MGLRMIAPKRIKKVKTMNGQEVLRRLEAYLKSNAVMGEPVEILCGFWKDQQDAITYQELRQAVREGEISQETLRLWQQDYSILIADSLRKMWKDAIAEGSVSQPILDGKSFRFSMQKTGILNWINERGAEFVTASTQDQKDAIAALLTKKMRDGHTVDELSRLIRPCIGLTEGDAKAAVKLYDSIVANLKKEHPRMKPENIRRRALDATQKYAERKHRARAMTIAQTESAFAYNRGADEGIRQAQEQNLIGKCKKRWNTSGDDQVCQRCAFLAGVEVDMDSDFDIGGKLLFNGQHLLPPAHPRCACAVEYIEVEPPVYTDIPQMQVDITQAGSFREYSDDEINDMARQTEGIASKHISVASKWSGHIIVDDGRERTGKLWNCDILAMHMTAPHMILHEQIHARSISYYEVEIYLQYKYIEEASVQFMTQEISKLEDIEIIASQYDEVTNALKQIGQRIGIYKTDYDFAKFMIELPVPERLVWLSGNLYDILGKDVNATIEEYQKYSDLLEMLYAKRW